jgi:hypothetical protein
METMTTKDGVELFYKDWGRDQPIVGRLFGLAGVHSEEQNEEPLLMELRRY